MLLRSDKKEQIAWNVVQGEVTTKSRMHKTLFRANRKQRANYIKRFEGGGGVDKRKADDIKCSEGIENKEQIT